MISGLIMDYRLQNVSIKYILIDKIWWRTYNIDKRRPIIAPKHRKIDILIKCCCYGDRQKIESLECVPENPAHFYRAQVTRLF